MYIDNKKVHQWYWSYEYPDFLNSDGDFVEFDIYIHHSTIGDSSNTSGGGSISELVKSSKICEHDYRVRYHARDNLINTREILCDDGTTDYNPINDNLDRRSHTLSNAEGRQINTFRECSKCFRKICTPCYRDI
jgi:hypothetical protein